MATKTKKTAKKPTPINKVAPVKEVKPESKLVSQYVSLDSFRCSYMTPVKKTKKNPDGQIGCKNTGTILKNIFIEDKTKNFNHGHYLGYVVFCDAHKKEIQKRDIDAGVKFTEL